MNEIERAKVQAAYDECYKIYSFYSEHRDTILSVLRAELDRERNPKTCDGCRDEGLLYCGNCIECVRARNYTDNYEPKGEKS